MQSKSMKEKFENNIKIAIDITEKLNISENVEITFINTIEDSGTATKDSGNDWHLALNKYRIKMQCTVVKIGEIKYEMRMKYGIEDYYDWNPNTDTDYKTLFNDIDNKELEKIPGDILDILPEYLYTMHKAGLARNYTNHGEAMYKITWYENGKDYYQIVEM